MRWGVGRRRPFLETFQEVSHALFLRAQVVVGGFGVGFERRLGMDRESLEARAAAADGMAPEAAPAGAPQGESTAPSLPLLKAADPAP